MIENAVDAAARCSLSLVPALGQDCELDPPELDVELPELDVELPELELELELELPPEPDPE
ncbi:MAG TPA: hypothetical protein VGM06_13940 [Polyangiaceae bacterium]|jgi:hypothetical protein